MEIKRGNTKTFILCFGKWVIKIPYTFGTWQELQREKLAIEKVKSDPYFSSFLLDYKYFFGYPITNRLPVFKNEGGNKLLIKKYFQSAFREADSWPVKSFKDLLDTEIFFDFISKNKPASYNFWQDFLKANLLPQSSSHGDFNENNILVDGGRLYFIDWSRYRHSSSRYFDLIDFYIYSQQGNGQSWIDAWKKEANFSLKAIEGIEIKPELFMAYAVWKVSQEIRALSVMRAFNQHKRKKYFNFISYLEELLRPKTKRI